MDALDSGEDGRIAILDEITYGKEKKELLSPRFSGYNPN